MNALLALALMACSSSGAGVRSKAERDDGPEPELSIDARDQYALARAMLAARTLDGPGLQRASARTEREWNGRRVRWEMMRVDALCHERCLFAPFDHARLANNDLSFLARTDFAENERARLDELCSPHAPRCVVELEGTLELVFDTTETRLTLMDARVIGARARRESEHFMSRPVPAISNDDFRDALTRGLGDLSLALDESRERSPGARR